MIEDFDMDDADEELREKEVVELPRIQIDHQLLNE